MKAKDWIRRIAPLKACATDEQTQQFLAAVSELEAECRAMATERLKRLANPDRRKQRGTDFVSGYMDAFRDSMVKWNAVVHGVADGGPQVFPLVRGIMALEQIRFCQNLLQGDQDSPLASAMGREQVVGLYWALKAMPVTWGFQDYPRSELIIAEMDEYYYRYMSNQIDDLTQESATVGWTEYSDRMQWIHKEVQKMPLKVQATFNPALERLLSTIHQRWQPPSGRHRPANALNRY